VEALQAEIQGNVENNKALLKGVQESFAVNLDEMNKTVIGLDARLKASIYYEAEPWKVVKFVAQPGHVCKVSCTNISQSMQKTFLHLRH